MRMSGWHRMMGGMMSRALGLPVHFDHEDFDEVYVGKLVDDIRTSPLDHALLLAQDEVYRPDGTRREFGSFHVPNDYLFAVCGRHPEFLPAVSIHPGRRDALAELDRCLALGARALKLLPNCLDVDCSSPDHDRFWETMAEAGLPLLAHTGGEMTVPVANKRYEDPRTLRRPLEVGVKVIAAHAASRSGLFDKDYFDVLIGMMRDFPRLYSDTSALNTPMRSAAFRKILRCDFQDRFLHGSDFPVPVGASYARWRGLIDRQAQKRAERTANLIERDLLLKQAVGFDESHFTRIWDVLRPVG